LSPACKALQADIVKQQHTIDELEQYLGTLTGIVEQQSQQLKSAKKFSNSLGLTTDLDTAYKTEVQAFNQVIE
jgi:hypothetical protein